MALALVLLVGWLTGSALIWLGVQWPAERSDDFAYDYARAAIGATLSFGVGVVAARVLAGLRSWRSAATGAAAVLLYPIAAWPGVVLVYGLLFALEAVF